MFPIILLTIVAVLIVDFVVAKMFTNIAKLKGYGSEVHAFAMCFLLGIIGYIYVAALPDKIQQQQNQERIELFKNKE